MLELYFEGWFQCRLARDPDPSDEKGGISGASFATVYEPDLDRIIRLNDAVASRAMYLPDGHEVPKVGVSVKSVYIDGQRSAAHPLLNARVDLLDNAVFQSLNGVFSTPGNEIIDPFHISVSRENLHLSRKDLWDLTRPDLTMYDMPLDSPLLARRSPVSQESNSVDVRQATGIFNPAGYKKKRVFDLKAAIDEKEQARIAAAGEDIAAIDLQIAGLQQRLDALTIPAELNLLFESQIALQAAKALDARQSQPEILLAQIPEAAPLVEEFAKRKIKFSDDAVFVVGLDPSAEGATRGDPACSIYWQIKDPFHWVNPYLGKQPPLFSGQLDSMLYLPAEFRIEKLLQRGTAYAIIAFQELEVWQSKVFKILLDSRVFYGFDIRGPAQVKGDLGVVVAEDLPWPVSFWVGAWDNDALSGYMKGCLQVPLKHRASASGS
jgi:hypothetical protein